MPRPRKISAPRPYVEKVSCPFTGREIELRKLGDGSWMGVGQFYTTKLFQTRRQLLYWLLHVDGVAPAFDAVVPLSTAEREPPHPDPFEDVKEIASAAQAFVEEIIK